MADLAPIALFVYRRAHLLDRVLDALEACPEFGKSDVYVFSDGARSAAAEEDVAAVRALVRSRLRPNMRLIESPNNKGLACSIIESVTRLCAEYGRIIVIEDDLIVSPAILRWFNAALERFADERSVMQISGYIHDLAPVRARGTGVFLPMTESWGWATWKRAWDQFDPLATGWERLATDAKLRRRFDLGDVYPFARMLSQQMNGRIDSWAIRWYWTMFKAGALTLYPPGSFVINEGDDALATHGSWRRRIVDYFGCKPQVTLSVEFSLPEIVSLDENAFILFRRSISRSRMYVPPSIETIFAK